jgi:hypothetical protein
VLEEREQEEREQVVQRQGKALEERALEVQALEVQALEVQALEELVGQGKASGQGRELCCCHRQVGEAQACCSRGSRWRLK